MQYSSLIRFIYAKSLVMDLNLWKTETKISVLCEAQFNTIALSNRWNLSKAHLCLDSKHLSGHCRAALPQSSAPPTPRGRLMVWIKPACWCGCWHLLTARGLQYHLSRTKAVHSFLISDGKKGWRLTLPPRLSLDFGARAHKGVF